MSAEECRVTDWAAVGYEDGARGYTTSRFTEHRQACAKHGIAANFRAYQQGRADGLEEFCQPSRGFITGKSGNRYYGVCPAELEPDFLTAYNQGRELYTLQARVNSANAAISRKQRKLTQTEERIVAIGAELINNDTTKSQRIELLAELKNLSERKGSLEQEIEQHIEERAAAEHDLYHYQHTELSESYY